jgi:hypothetical protein
VGKEEKLLHYFSIHRAVQNLEHGTRLGYVVGYHDIHETDVDNYGVRPQERKILKALSSLFRSLHFNMPFVIHGTASLRGNEKFHLCDKNDNCKEFSVNNIPVTVGFIHC